MFIIATTPSRALLLHNPEDSDFQKKRRWFSHVLERSWPKMRIVINYSYLQSLPKSLCCQELAIELQALEREGQEPRAAAAAAKLLQLCPTLCDPIDSRPPSVAILGILQARTPEWVAISFSNAWKWKVRVKSLSRVQLLATPWTAAHQAPPSMGFSRQEFESR